MTGNRYQKVSGSREIGRHLSVDGSGATGNRSHSFRVFVSGLRKLAG